MLKEELRQYIRNKKRENSEQELRALSLPIINKVLAHPLVLEATSILLYYSLPDEVYTHDLIDKLVAMGKKVFLPKVISDTELSIHPYTSQKDLTIGSYGIMEPNTPQLKENSSLLTLNSSLILVPGLAFDSAGYRLGRGKGYYDRLLHNTELYKIGVCFPFQIVEKVPHDSYDIKMDEVIF